MFYKKKDLPEESELVLCTVKKVLYHSVFVSIDEYTNLEGMIHISEVSPGRIRNIRDFVREGKKIVCKVLRVNQENKHVDLSLRRVSVSMRKKKNAEYKQEQKAEKILESVASKLKTSLEEVYEKLGRPILEEYGSLNECFQAVIKGETDLKGTKSPEKYRDTLVTVVHEKLKLPEVSINATLKLKSLDPKGIEVIKDCIKKAKGFAENKEYKAVFSYISAPQYNLKVTAQDYKSAEKGLQEMGSLLISSIKARGGEGSITKR